MRSKSKSRDYFAEWLRRTLRNRGTSNGALARALDVSPSAVTRWTKGGTISLENVQALAKYLDVDFLRLAVTAELFDQGTVNADQLTMPEDTAQRQYVLEQIMRIRDITEEQRQVLMQAYDNDIERRRRPVENNT